MKDSRVRKKDATFVYAPVYAPVSSERLSPREFLKLKDASPGTIKRSRFVPPRIGDGTFGHVEVIYKHPRLRRDR